MKRVVLYPGRFQPMLPHHAEVFQHLVGAFPEAEVYIATSNKVEPDKSPFNAKEKMEIMTKLHNIPEDRILIVKSPYNFNSYAEVFDLEDTHAVFAVGGKDMEDDPRFSFKPKRDGSPSYLQKINTTNNENLPMSERGYVYTSPTIGEDEAASASQFRVALKNAPDMQSAKSIFTKTFGEFNQEVFDLVYDRIAEDIMESLDLLKILAGLTEAPVNFKPGKGPMDYEPGISKKDQKAAADREENMMKSDPEAVGFTDISPEGMVSVDTGKPIRSKGRFHSMANQLPKGVDQNDPEIKKELFLKLLAKSPEYLLGEINARLENDDNGLAVSDRLSRLIDNLPNSGVMGLEADDRSFVLKLVKNAMENMELHRADSSDEEEFGDLPDPEEYMPEESLDLNDVRFDYNLHEDLINLIVEGKLKEIIIDALQMTEEEFNQQYGEDYDYDELNKQFNPEHPEYVEEPDPSFEMEGISEDPEKSKSQDLAEPEADTRKDYFQKAGGEPQQDLSGGSAGDLKQSDIIRVGDKFGIDNMAVILRFLQKTTDGDYASLSQSEKDEGSNFLNKVASVIKDTAKSKMLANLVGMSEPVTASKEYEESFDPRAEQSREDEEYDRLMQILDKDGEEGLADTLHIPMDQLNDEIDEVGREKGLHPDDDRDEILQIYIEDLVDNADWKDHGEYEGDADERAEESLEEAVEDTASMALEAAMAELKKLAGMQEESIKEDDDQEPQTKSIQVNKSIKLAGDSIYDENKTNPEEVNVKEINVTGSEAYVVHDGPMQVYTDTGFEKAVCDMLGKECSWSEQGMQEDGVAHFDVEMSDDDEEPKTNSMQVNKSIELAGDSIYDENKTNPKVVNVKEINVTGSEAYVVHDGPMQVYTDTGFEKAVCDMLGKECSWSEQGMQEDGVAHFDVEMNEEIKRLKHLAGIEEQSLDTGVSSAEFTKFGSKRAEVEKLYGKEGLEMYSKIWDEVKRARGPKATADEAFRVLVQKMAGKEKLGSKPLDMTGIG